MGAHAIPPSPPTAIFKKIETSAARNCITEDNIRVSDLKDTGSIKFLLQVKNDSNDAVLSVFVDGNLTESFKVKCR